MNVTSTKSLTARRGATLIEVLGGLALLGALLVAILYAQTRYTRQAATADRRLRAVAAADALLVQWWREPERFPASSSGEIAEDDRFTWRTRRVHSDGLQNLDAQVVRLEIYDQQHTSLVVVDVVLPAQGGPS